MVRLEAKLGELTQTADFALVDTVLEETGTREKRLRVLPARVVVYFVLALFEACSYRAVSPFQPDGAVLDVQGEVMWW
ncbi:transposase domain-containing protein [Streptomyces sp. NPDC057743]|uniref:transposase domain-containing protein n=1 Tax=Streptomyces sp. NPDC057743 TaxID=3346236 RepID=UPI0036B5E417